MPDRTHFVPTPEEMREIIWQAYLDEFAKGIAIIFIMPLIGVAIYGAVEAVRWFI